MHSSVKFISEQYDTLLNKNEELQKNQQSVLNENKILKNHQRRQSHEIVVLKKEVDRISCLVPKFFWTKKIGWCSSYEKFTRFKQYWK